MLNMLTVLDAEFDESYKRIYVVKFSHLPLEQNIINKRNVCFFVIN